MVAQELTTAAADIGAIGDKLATAAVAQNLVWVLAAVKGDLRDHLRRGRSYFLYGSVITGVLYACGEGYLGYRACELIRAAGATDVNTARLVSAAQLMFSIRAIGALGSSLLAALAFWGVLRLAEAETA